MLRDTIYGRLISAGCGTELEAAIQAAPSYVEVQRMPWQGRPNFCRSDDKLLYCTHRCLSSERGGGTCQCINHPAESWMVVGQYIDGQFVPEGQAVK